ncbi:MAG: amidase, partial [Sediminicola sp.]
MIMKKVVSILIFLFLTLGCKQEKETNISLDELTISEIHSNYSKGVYNSEQLVQAFIDRIKTKDSSINTITYINPEALAIAKRLDEEFKSTGKLRPLHGIPMIVKDNFNTTGM